MEKKQRNIKNYCRICNNQTNHAVVCCEKFRSQGDYDYAIEYMIIKCLGCDIYAFRQDDSDIEQAYPTENGQWEVPITTKIYPSFMENHKEIDGLWYLPENIRIVYTESLNALIAECNLLAGAGFRAIIEAICLDKEIRGKNLETKINNLSKEGLITKKESERLHSIRFLGNDSIHEMKVPQKQQLILVLNIIEHLLKNLYLIDLDIDSKLDTLISDYEKFISIIDKRLKGYQTGDEYPLIKFLDRDIRRVKDYFVDFEKQLQSDIKNNSYEKLQLGKSAPYLGSKDNVQHYIVI